MLGAALVATAFAVWSGRDEHGSTPSACARNVTTALLPVWARAGFSPGGFHWRHLVSDNGQMVAVLFGPLRVHQPAGTFNKVLWIARAGFGPLRIRAQLEGTSRTATRKLPNGPGPSYVNMPAAGCWHMSLSWPGQHDTIALQYRP
jgi:hypothetical protein